MPKMSKKLNPLGVWFMTEAYSRGLTSSQIAKDLGTTPQTLCNVTRGEISDSNAEKWRTKLMTYFERLEDENAEAEDDREAKI